MTDLIALLILVLILGLAVAYIVKAKRRGVKCIGCPAGGNCSSAKKMKRKKLDGPVIGKRILKISGMHCEHCARNVTIMLDRIDGVSADVNLSAGRAVVSYDRDISNEVLKDAVEKIGYQVVSIS
ncbi:MAG TPA: heavy-metal-associated domain-containing protein [Candidatus Blautia avicola]|uniref:Heavy-metal-associated domain-containing protein n=1 Tax=Candidatus Blautia avicola TaxID=2838483 RepID=A0A9D2QSF6_9FIRM|nr:heavy-metal-associated domain-containing protein [Candidatus Blautia avicola]